MVEQHLYNSDDYWAALYRQRVIVIIVVVLSAVFSYYFSSVLTPLYEATAQFYVPQDVIASQGPEQGRIRIPGLQDQARTYVALLESRDAHKAVADQLEARSLGEVLRAADFDVTPSASLIVYTRDKDPVVATRMAELFVEYFQSFHSGVMRNDLNKSIDSVNRSLAEHEQNKRDSEYARWDYLREQKLGSPAKAMSELEAQRASFEDRIKSAAVELRVDEERIKSLQSKLESEAAAFQSGKVASGVSDGLYASLRNDLTAAQVSRDTAIERHSALIQSKREIEELITDLTFRLQKIRDFDEEITRNQNFIVALRAIGVNLTNELLRLKDTIMVLEKPSVSNSPVFPIIWLNTLVGAVGGLLLGIIYALFVDHLQIRTLARKLKHLEGEDWFKDILSEEPDGRSERRDRRRS